MLFYNARYDDPGIGRFISADSIVPGNASGGMDGIAYKPLTVDVHEPGFISAVNRENQFGPWYTLSDNERQQLGSPWGPSNPQALNRYSYVGNNPVRSVDPSGHGTCTDRPGCGGVIVNNSSQSIWIIGNIVGPCPYAQCNDVMVELKPGESSIDKNIGDADGIVLQIDPNNPDGFLSMLSMTTNELSLQTTPMEPYL